LNPIDPKAAALVVIDVQKAFDLLEARGIPRNNPDATARISDLLAAFRNAGSAIVHIRHRGTSPGTLFKGAACEPRDEARERRCCMDQQLSLERLLSDFSKIPSA